MRYCPNYSAILTANKKDNHFVYRARCKKWSCPYCAIKNRNIWRSRIMNEVKSTPDIQTWYFYTFTLLGCDHKGLMHSLIKWRDTWQKLRKRMKRDLGKYRYVRVFEMHKDNTLHIHMLCDKSYEDCYIVQKTETANSRRESTRLTQHLNNLSLGYIHDIKIISTPKTKDNGVARNVSAYIVKYLTKDIQSTVRHTLTDTGQRIRMIQPSHKWYNETKNDSDLDFDRVELAITTYLSIPASGKAFDISADRDVSIDDFYEHEYYPNKTSDLIDIADSDDKL